MADVIKKEKTWSETMDLLADLVIKLHEFHAIERNNDREIIEENNK
jgi:hypothetical protein